MDLIDRFVVVLAAVTALLWLSPVLASAVTLTAPTPTPTPTATPTPTPTTGPAPRAVSLATTCKDFASQAAAQAAYRAHPLLLANLDADRDGVACEDNPAPYDTKAVTLAAQPVPQAITDPTPTPSAAPAGLPDPPVTGSQ